MILSGVTVAEIGDTVSASSAGAVLRRLGASVTKMSLPFPTRVGLPSGERWVADILGAGKRVDPSRKDVWTRAAEADIVVCDVSRAEFAATGVGIDAYVANVVDWNRSSWVTVSPFGLIGPHRTYLGGELLAVASGGLSAYMRSSRGRPMKPGGCPALITAGHFAALAGLHGLHLVDRGTGPAHLDLSVQDSVLVSGTFLECAHLLFGCPGRGGTSRYSAPKGMARCRDGRVLIVIIEDHQWRQFKAALGNPTEFGSIETREQRREHSPMIQQRFEEWTSLRTVAECTETLQNFGVPVTAVSSCEDLLADQDLAQRGFFDTLPDGVRIPGLPAVLTPRAGQPRVAPRRPRILDMSQVLAGPLATSWLGAMGLDVVKLEDPNRIDTYRRGGPFEGGVEDIERSVYFSAANYSKRSVRADLQTAEGLRTLHRLVEAADYVVQNLSEKRAASLLTPELLSRTRAGVVASSGFGRVDSRRHAWRAYGHNIHAHGGLVNVSRDIDGEPRDMGTSWGDPLTGVWIALFVMAATSPRAVQRPDIDLSMVEVVAAEFPDLFVAEQRGYAPARAAESRFDGYAPHGIFQCSGTDSWLALAVSSDEQWAALLNELGRPSALLDAKFETAAARSANQDRLEGELEATLNSFNPAALAVRLQARGVAAFPVLDAQHIIDSQHLAERGLFQLVRHPVWGQRRLTSLPWRYGGGPTISIDPPPLLGEHTNRVMVEWR